MAVQTIHTFARVHAHLVFMHDRVLGSDVTFGTFSGRPYQIRGGLLRLYFWSGAIKQKCSQDQCERNHDCNKNRAKRHAMPPPETSIASSIPGAGIILDSVQTSSAILSSGVMLTSVVGNSEKDHCKNACQDEKSGKHGCCFKQKSLEPVELSTGDHHNQLPYPKSA